MALAQEEVSSVVVLVLVGLSCAMFCGNWGGGGGGPIAYSLAKTPLKAAQAPLAMAKRSQGDLGAVMAFWAGGMAEGRRGSAAASIGGGGKIAATGRRRSM